MKSKNLISLSVAAVFTVLSATGLLIYFGQGNHFVDHTHAWMGILFFSVAVFHIVNNWASIKGYSINKKQGGVRRELLIPVLITIVFTAGIAADLPVFKDLANAGKKLFGPKKKQERGLSQTKIDSLALKLTTDFQQAMSTGDTAALANLVTEHTVFINENGQLLTRKALVGGQQKTTMATALTNQLEQANTLEDHVIVATGTTNLPDETALRFTNVLKDSEGKWRIAAYQLTKLPVKASQP